IMNMNTLFHSNFATDDRELTNLLARSDAADVMKFLENLWQKYYPYIKAEEEKALRGDLKAQPHARIWEMYLTIALKDFGFEVDKKQKEGPDIRLSNPRIWVEAVTSTDGAKRSKNSIQPGAEVPEILPSESMWGGPPEDGIVLRCLSSIHTKLKKLNRYRDGKGKGIVKETEPYVI